MLNAFVALAAEEHSDVPNHWLVGGITLALLLGLLMALLIFGAGREHS